MKFEWSPEKNSWLKKHRNISFEQVIYHLSHGNVWKIADHPNQDKYPNQKIYFVIMEGYVYLVPHVVKSNYIFLKTVFPSRKATGDYQREREKSK